MRLRRRGMILIGVPQTESAEPGDREAIRRVLPLAGVTTTKAIIKKMRKPCRNCGCLKTQHGIDIETVTLSNGFIWYRYLKPCLTVGCHCANYLYLPGITSGMGRGDGIVVCEDVGTNIRHLERQLRKVS
jgi:hypothetical protein